MDFIDRINARNYLVEHPPLSFDVSKMALNLPDLLLCNVELDELTDTIYKFCTPNSIVIYPNTNGISVCHHCGSLRSNIQQYKIRLLDDCPVEGKRTVLAVIYAAKKCSDCGKTYSPPLICADRRARCTNRHKQLILNDALSKKTFSQTAYDHHVSTTFVESLFLDEVNRRTANVKYEATEHIGIDETKVNTSNKSKKMCFVIYDTTPGFKAGGKLIALEQTKLDKESIVKLFDKFDDPTKIKTVSMDMSPAFKAAVEVALPHARIIVDRFHVVKSLTEKTKETATKIYFATKADLQKSANTTIDTELVDSDFGEDAMSVEQENQNRDFLATLVEDDDSLSNEVREARRKLQVLIKCYNNKALGSSSNNLSVSSQIRLMRLFKEFPEFDKLYRTKEKMRTQFYDSKTVEEAKTIAADAKKLIPKSDPNYSSMRTFFSKLESNNPWSTYIYDYFSEPEGQRYTNAALESINGYIKDVNRASRGLSFEVLKYKVLFGSTRVEKRPERYNSSQAKEKMLYMAHMNELLPTVDLSALVQACVSVGILESDYAEKADAATVLSHIREYAQVMDESFGDALIQYGALGVPMNEVELYCHCDLSDLIAYQDLYLAILAEDSASMALHHPRSLKNASEYDYKMIWYGLC